MSQTKKTTIQRLLNPGSLIQNTQLLKSQKDQILLQLLQIVESLHSLKIAHNFLVQQNIYISRNESNIQDELSGRSGDQFTVVISEFYYSTHQDICLNSASSFSADIKAMAQLFNSFGYFASQKKTDQLRIKQQKFEQILKNIQQAEADDMPITIKQLRQAFQCFITCQFKQSSEYYQNPEEQKLLAINKKINVKTSCSTRNSSTSQTQIQMLDQLDQIKYFSEISSFQMVNKNADINQINIWNSAQVCEYKRRYSENQNKIQVDAQIQQLALKVKNLKHLLKLTLFCYANDQIQFTNYFIALNQNANNQLQVQLQKIVLRLKTLRNEANIKIILQQLKKHKGNLNQLTQIIKAQKDSTDSLLNIQQYLLHQPKGDNYQFKQDKFSHFKESILSKYRQFKDKNILINFCLILDIFETKYFIRNNDESKYCYSFRDAKKMLQIQTQNQLEATVDNFFAKSRKLKKNKLAL